MRAMNQFEPAASPHWQPRDAHRFTGCTSSIAHLKRHEIRELWNAGSK
jgi:hypothetical protein